MFANVLEAITYHFGAHIAAKCSMTKINEFRSSAEAAVDSPIFVYDNYNGLFEIRCGHSCTYYCDEDISWSKRVRIMNGGIFVYESDDCKKPIVE
jgi:hypothetical protein